MDTIIIKYIMDLIKSTVDISENPFKLKYKFSKSSFIIFYDDVEYILNLKNNEFIETDDIYSQHLLRLLKNNNFDKINEFNVLDVIIFLNNNIPSIYEYCTLCGSKILDLKKISTCEKCLNKSNDIVTNDCVTNCFNNDPIVFNVLILSAYSCLKHPKRELVFKPYDSEMGTFDYLDKNLKYNINNFSNLITIVNESISDKDLKNKIGSIDYKFLKYIINNNITDLKSTLIFNNDIFASEKIIDITKTNEILTLAVKNDLATETKFSSDSPSYLFHGSPLANWYSILRNGLQNHSKTPLMANGAAYGLGVYLSDNLSVSVVYGVDKYSNQHLNVIGVTQVLPEKKTYHKGKNIYVVPDGENLMLKYIIIMNSSKFKQVHTITDYFINYSEKMASKGSLDSINIRNKRILNDSCKINKVIKKNNWIFDESVADCWKITFDETILNIKFPKDYPMSPPFLWISKTDRNIEPPILSKGAIFINEFVPTNWNSATKIHRHIKKIIAKLSQLNYTNMSVFDEETAFSEYCTKIKTLSF